MKIYHNPKCSKSRETLSLIKKNTSKFEIIEYLKTPLTANEIILILDKLKLKPIDIIRKNEEIWKRDYNKTNISDKQLINTIVKNPKLLERPIVTNETKAIIGRPPENVLTLFS